MNKQYLGDSVYVELDERLGGIKLTTENGLPTPSNLIYLEPEVIFALAGYLEANLKFEEKKV